MDRHAEITQNNKFAISLEYLKKEVSDEVDFLHEKYESMKVSYRLIPWFFWGWSRIHKAPKRASFQCLYNILKKKLEIKLNFCMQINIKVSDKLIETLFASKFFTRWYCHWWTWSRIIKLLKVTSLHHLQYVIKEMELEMEFIFCMQINIRVLCKLALSFLMEAGRHVQSTQSRKLVKFLKYIKKKCFCVLWRSKEFWCLHGSSNVCCYLFVF